jgi:hypothetical protein
VVGEMSHLALWTMQLSFYLRGDENHISGQKKGVRKILKTTKKRYKRLLEQVKKQCNSQYDSFIRNGRYWETDEDAHEE